MDCVCYQGLPPDGEKYAVWEMLPLLPTKLLTLRLVSSPSVVDDSETRFWRLLDVSPACLDDSNIRIGLSEIRFCLT